MIDIIDLEYVDGFPPVEDTPEYPTLQKITAAVLSLEPGACFRFRGSSFLTFDDLLRVIKVAAFNGNITIETKYFDRWLYVMRNEDQQP